MRLRPYIEIEIQGRGRRTTDTLQPGWCVRGGRLFATAWRHLLTNKGETDVVRGYEINHDKILSSRRCGTVFARAIRLWSYGDTGKAGGRGRRTSVS